MKYIKFFLYQMIYINNFVIFKLIDILLLIYFIQKNSNVKKLIEKL